MRLLSLLFVLASIEAKRQRLGKERDNIKRTKTSNVDVYPESFGTAVDFGHVYRNGGPKQVAVAELDMIEPTSVEQARQLLKKIGSDIINIKKPDEALGFSNPRDAMQYRDQIGQENSYRSHSLNRPSRVKNITHVIKNTDDRKVKKTYYDRSSRIQGDPLQKSFSDRNNSHKEQLFSKSGFNLLSDEAYETGNWTTCKEFAKGAVFHPDDVINIPWLPFYIWSTRRFSTAVIHTLTYPTKKLVKQYKKQFDPYLNVKIDWEPPKLLLKESKDVLLIAGDRKGLFYGIPYVELPSSVQRLNLKMPVVMIRLKIVDPYLAMMFCDDKYAVLMSVAGSEPNTDTEKIAEAAVLKFQGQGSAATRDLEHEARKAKYEIEMKRKEEASKYVEIEKPANLDPSSW